MEIIMELDYEEMKDRSWIRNGDYLRERRLGILEGVTPKKLGEELEIINDILLSQTANMRETMKRNVNNGFCDYVILRQVVGHAIEITHLSFCQRHTLSDPYWDVQFNGRHYGENIPQREIRKSFTDWFTTVNVYREVEAKRLPRTRRKILEVKMGQERLQQLHQNCKDNISKWVYLPLSEIIANIERDPEIIEQRRDFGVLMYTVTGDEKFLH